MAWRRPLATRRGTAVLVLTAALLAMLPVTRANAAPPTPPVPLPPDIDLIDEYQGQQLCDPAPKVGTATLREALWTAYGRSIWAGISRDCNVSWDPGISEHKDGRAIDWGVTVRNPASKAIGDEFFAWVTANNGEMARRMGIMYIIWDSRMWRLYDMNRGFPEYRNCVSQLTSTSYDTTCHRDHMHISMTWHGAGASTSWYDGTAVTQPTCRSGAPISASAGTRSAPSLMLDPMAGIGVAGGTPCYLGKSIQTLRIPPKDLPGLVDLRVSGISLNAPSQVKIWTNAGGGVSLGKSAPLPWSGTVPVGSDGLIYVQVPVGQGTVRIEGLGTTAVQQLRAFVREGYRDVLGRDPDPGGSDYWTGVLLNGQMTREQVFRGLVYSAEGSRRTATAMYRDILGREPDAKGLDYWTLGISTRSISVKSARAGFWSSSEKLGKYTSPEQWVADLYRTELGREPDKAGLSWWTTVYRDRGPMDAAQGVIGSTEWAQRQTDLHYRAMLNRKVDPVGAKIWPPVIVNGDLPDLQIGIGGSDEYFTLANSKVDPRKPAVAEEQLRAFVREGYRDVLGRDPDPAGWDYWTSVLRSGQLSREQVFRGLVYSAEGSRRTATAMYRDILGREPDAQGLDYWTLGISTRSIPVKSARAGFWSSNEKIGKYTSPEQWVADLYRTELGREPDKAGLSWWTTVYRDRGPMDAAQGVIGSTEWAQRQTDLHYRAMLNRKVDPVGANIWPPVIVNGDLPDLQIGIGGSDEYFTVANS